MAKRARRSKRQDLPPLPFPDLRFEGSYMRAIAPAQGNLWKIAYITIKDQVLFPLLQGTLWALIITGWRSWNMTATQHGSIWGHRFHQWWSDLNSRPGQWK